MDTDSRPGTAPRWERRKEARPSELIAAALDLFVERGFAATRLEDVAARAGVSKGTLYIYFDGKEDLFKAVVRTGMVRAIEEAEQLVDQHQGSAAELLREIVLGWWEFIASTKLSGIPKLMIAESQNFPELARFYHAEVIQRGSRLFVRTLERGMASGEFRKLDIEYTVRGLIAPLMMRVIWQHSFACFATGPDVDSRRYLEHVLDLNLHGLMAKPA